MNTKFLKQRLEARFLPHKFEIYSDPIGFVIYPLGFSDGIGYTKRASFRIIEWDMSRYVEELDEVN